MWVEFDPGINSTGCSDATLQSQQSIAKGNNCCSAAIEFQSGASDDTSCECWKKNGYFWRPRAYAFVNVNFHFSWCFTGKWKKLRVTSGVHCHPSNSNMANICFYLCWTCVPRSILVAENSATQPIQQCLVLYNQRLTIMLLIKQLQMLELQVESLLASYMLMLKKRLCSTAGFH